MSGFSELTGKFGFCTDGPGVIPAGAQYSTFLCAHNTIRTVACKDKCEIILSIFFGHFLILSFVPRSVE